MHGIVEMMSRARENEREFGLLNANGWYLTKHSMGIYSCREPQGQWQSTTLQSTQEASVKLLKDGSGPAQMETFTVSYDKNNKPKRGVVIARLNTGERCIATTESERDTLEALRSFEGFCLAGELETVNGKNLFRF